MSSACVCVWLAAGWLARRAVVLVRACRCACGVVCSLHVHALAASDKVATPRGASTLYMNAFFGTHGFELKIWGYGGSPV